MVAGITFPPLAKGGRGAVTHAWATAGPSPATVPPLPGCDAPIFMVRLTVMNEFYNRKNETARRRQLRSSLPDAEVILTRTSMGFSR